MDIALVGMALEVVVEIPRSVGCMDMDLWDFEVVVGLGIVVGLEVVIAATFVGFVVGILQMLVRYEGPVVVVVVEVVFVVACSVGGSL